MPTLTHRPAAGNINTPFGPRPLPTPTSPPIHYGQDYGWGGGDPIYAAAAGQVIDYYYLGAYGNRVRIRHSDGTQTWYCHLASATVTQGDWVRAGQRIATMGATGNVTGKHLHFELRNTAGSAIDPEPYFKIGSITPAGEEIEVIEMAFTQDDAETLLSYKFEWNGVTQSLRAHLMKIAPNVWNDQEPNSILGEGETSRTGDLLFAAYREATYAHRDTANLVEKLGLGGLNNGEFVNLLRAAAKSSSLSAADRALLEKAAAPVEVTVDSAAVGTALASNKAFVDTIVSGVVAGLVANATVEVNLESK